MFELKILYDNLVEQLETYQNLLELQKEKHVVLSHAGVAELNEIVSKEQVEVMRARSLEAKRTKIVSNLSLEGQSLREIISDINDIDTKIGFEKLYDLLSSTLEQVKTLSSNCKDIIDTKLHYIQPTVLAPKNSKNTAYDSINLSAGNPHTTAKLDKLF